MGFRTLFDSSSGAAAFEHATPQAESDSRFLGREAAIPLSPPRSGHPTLFACLSPYLISLMTNDSYLYASCTARNPFSIAEFVPALAEASEFAIVIRPKGCRPRTQGLSDSAAYSGSHRNPGL